jgi:hypothetical protein
LTGKFCGKKKKEKRKKKKESRVDVQSTQDSRKSTQ